MPQYVSYSTTSNTSATSSIVINVPASTQAGDLLIAHLLVHNNPATVATPSGWTLNSYTQTTETMSYVFSKTHNGSEPSAYTFTVNAAYPNTGAMIAFRNAVISWQTGQINAASTTLTAPSAPGYNPSMLLCLFGQRVSTVPTFTDSSGTMSKCYGFGNGSGYCAQTAFYQSIATTSSSGTKTITSSVSGESIGHSIVLTPPNQAPNAPTNISPNGTLQAPTLMKTLTPGFSWTFSDPDAGQSQSAFQYLIYDTSNTMIYDSIKQYGPYTSCQMPTGVVQPNTVYGVAIRTWDNAFTPAVSPYSAIQYFKTSQVPTVTNLTPGNPNSATPDFVTVTPLFSWVYSDPDGDAQYAYQISITDAAQGTVVYTSPKTFTTSTAYLLPTNTLVSNTKYSWNLTVWDNTQMSTTVNGGYFFTNALPGPVSNLSPVDNYRVTNRPVFMGVIGDDPDNNNQHFILEVADDAGFSVNMNQFWTLNSTVGWEVYNGTSWVPFPSQGVDSTYEGKQIRYTIQSDLTDGKTYYWKIAPYDASSGYAGQWSPVNRIRIGTTLQFQLKNPIASGVKPSKIVLVVNSKIPTDGTVPASLKIEACNNGLDSTPTWEDVTSAFAAGQYYAFSNTTKTASSWAVNCRITILANSSLGPIEVDGIGFSFQ